MNISKKLFFLIFVLIFITESSMAFFFNNNMNSDEFLSTIKALPNGSQSERQVSKVTLENMTLPMTELADIHFKSCKWNKVDAKEISLSNVIFESCEFNNVNLSGANLEQVVFIDSSLKNVIMNNVTATKINFVNSKISSNDPNIENSYNGLIANEIIVDRTELFNLNFFEAKAVFRFNKAKLNDITAQSLQSGSALYFQDTIALDVNFDGSILDNLEVINSTIDKRSSAGGGSIQNIRVENSKLEFALGYTSNIKSAVFENSGDVVIGGGKNNNTFTIKSCPKDTYVINAGGGVDKLEIENCHVSAIRFTDSTGKYISLKNVSTYSMDFRDSKIDRLILDNVSVRGKVKYQNTNIKNFESKNVSFGMNIKVWNENSNIEIKPNKILEEQP
jgi:uncharacterized protein YjbI with pentapeptide repeats